MEKENKSVNLKPHPDPKGRKERWGRKYQDRIGQNAREILHLNSKELVEVLKEHNLPQDNMKVFEIGAGGARNLYYIWKENNTIKLFANDLWEKESRKNMHSDIKDNLTFYEEDTLSLVTNNTITDIDLFLTSDHLMHIQRESTNKIIEKVRDEWKPKYIVIREVTKTYESEIHPRLAHDYTQFDTEYETVCHVNSVCNPNKESHGWYFIKILKRKK